MMKKHKILIIEDDADLREGLSFSFSSDGYEVAETETKKDGLRKMQRVVMIWFFLIVICPMEQVLNFVKKSAPTAIFPSSC